MQHSSEQQKSMNETRVSSSSSCPDSTILIPNLLKVKLEGLEIEYHPKESYGYVPELFIMDVVYY